ncbi:hypothetical protein, partial [Actinoplanes philippinensis]|uniref:hypothetical protein n=1 Tax=Actinoplanes philippinensis TaxID=35752 RepID=UPI003403F993
ALRQTITLHPEPPPMESGTAITAARRAPTRRGIDPPPPPLTTRVHQTTWHDDAADFNAGVDAARAKAPHRIEHPPDVHPQKAEGPR